jgi:hypothetical protein
MHNPTQPSITLPALSDKALEAFSFIIVTATEGGEYTRSDYRKWTDYKHGDTDKGFRAEVTVTRPRRRSATASCWMTRTAC